MHNRLSVQMDELYKQCLNWLAILLVLLWAYPAEQSVVAFVVPIIAGMALVWWVLSAIVEDRYA